MSSHPGGNIINILSSLPVKIGFTQPNVCTEPVNRIKCNCANKVYMLFDDNTYGYIHFLESESYKLYCLHDLVEILVRPEMNITEVAKTLGRELKDYITTHDDTICEGANKSRRRRTLSDSGIIIAIHYLSKHAYQTHKTTSLNKTLSTIPLSLHLQLREVEQQEHLEDRTPLSKDSAVTPSHPLVEDILNLDLPPYSALLTTKGGDLPGAPAWDPKGKVPAFISDCENLQFHTYVQQVDYLNLLKHLKTSLPLLTKIIKKHIGNAKGKKDIEATFNTEQQYMDTFTWAERLMYEKLVQNDYYLKLKVLDHKIDYGKRQIAKIFFHLHSLLNIRNSKHIGPIQKQLTDIMLSKQGELKYLFTVLNHFSVIGSLIILASTKKY